MKHSSWLVVLLGLYFLVPTIGLATALLTNDVDSIIESLKTNPSDTALLSQLGVAIKTCPDAKIKAHGLAVYALGYLLLGEPEVTQTAVNHLRNNHPGSSYLEKVSLDNLRSPCVVCGGTGSAAKPCPKCRGSSTCSGCNGTGYIRTITQNVRCSGCAGTGRCRDCNGTGQVNATCQQCSGKGRVFDRSKAQAAYSALLNEKQEMMQRERETSIREAEVRKTDEIDAAHRQTAQALAEKQKLQEQIDELRRQLPPGSQIEQTVSPASPEEPTSPHNLLTKDQWKKKLKESNFMVGTDGIWAEIEPFKKVMGTPDKTVAMGDSAIWYYQCRDGVIALDLIRSALDMYNQLRGRLNDF